MSSSAADRVVDRRRRPRDRRRARSRRARAEARDARDARRHEEGRRDRRRRDRPGRLRRDGAADDAQRPGLRGRRHHALLRREHARRRADHLDEGADERDAARTSRRSPTTGSREAVARDPALGRGVNVVDGKITYEPVAEAHDLEYTPLYDVLPLAAALGQADGSARRLRLLRRRDTARRATSRLPRTRSRRRCRRRKPVARGRSSMPNLE